MDCAVPLSSTRNMSPILPAPKLGPTDPAKPLASLKKESAIIFGDRAHPTFRIVNMAMLSR
jgi:hypothetical protein